MFEFDEALSDIFARRVTTGKLPLDEERAAICAARSGDETAALKLLYAYAYALREAAGLYCHAGGIRAHGTRDPSLSADLRMAAVEGFLEALYAFDLNGVHCRLAAMIEGYVANSMSTAVVTPVAVNVPERTLKRFYAILRAACGDPIKGAALAPRHSMTAETFACVLTAVRNVCSYDALHHANDQRFGGTTTERFKTGGAQGGGSAQPIGRTEYTTDSVEDKLLVEAAFAAVDDLERDVCRLAYGFTDYNPVPDAEIGHRLGLSRAKVQRIRSSALAKMRKALDVT